MKSFRSHRKSIERTKLKEDLSDEGILDNPDDLDILEHAGFVEVQTQPTVPHFVGTKSNITTEAVNYKSYDDITLNQLNDIEKYADRLFAKVGIDVEFTRHFLDRVNDARNKRQITPAELTRLFKQSYKKYGRTISKLGPAAQAVINDMRTDINMPFVLEPKGDQLELVAKTVMRKKGFKTSNQKFSFEQYINEKHEFFEKDVYEKITLPPPPRNDYTEIKKIKDAISTRTANDVESIDKHDEVPFHAIQEYCEKENLQFHIGEFEQLAEESSKVIMHFKEKFNRKRPWLVDESIRPLNSKTNKTPAYPSGHAAQSVLIANYVAGKFPDHKVGLMSAAKKCGWGRVQAGWHYVSDYKVGNQLGEELYKHMNKENFFSKEALEFDEQLRGLSEDIRIESERDKIAEKEKDVIQSLIEVNDAFNETEQVAADLIHDPFLRWQEPVEPDPKTPLDFAGQITGEGHILPEEMTIVQSLSEELTKLKRDLPNMMATTAGGGEVLIQYMDDVDESARTDGYFFQYRSSDNKFIGSASTVSAEQIQDVVGGMVTSNTETGMTVTYEDGDGTLDFVIGTLNQDTTGNAATATALETARTIHGVSFDGTANIDLTEVVQDTVGAMVTSNTETGITVAYQDGDGTLDFTIGTLNQDTTGNAATATALETARTIGGTSFDGTANIAVALAATATALASARTIGGVSFDGTANINLPGVNTSGTQDTSGTAATATLATTTTVTDSTANTNFPVVFHNESNGLLDDTGALRYNPSTGELLVPKLTVAGTTTQVDTVTMEASNAIVFEGATADAHETTLTVTDPTTDRTITLPNATGTVALTSSDITGNAATATALETARTIGGTSFDGTANIAVALSATATALATGRTIHGVSFDGTANIDLTEVVQDTVGAMFSSNTETGVTVTYQDGDGTIDVVVGTLNQDTTGNAATATALETARTIGGTSFDGSANIAVALAATATALASARTINGTSFDGTANITVTAAAGTLTGSTLASGVTASSLTSVGTLTTLTVDDITINGSTISDAADLTVDVGGDIILDADGGDFKFQDGGTEILRITNSSSDVIIKPMVDAKDVIFQQYDGTAVARIEDDGTFNVVSTNASTSQTTGGLIVAGGAGIAADLYVGDDLGLISDGAVLTFGADKEVTLTHVHDTGLRLEDSRKMIFGAGSDLTIHHDGSNSYISDAGTGSLYVLASVFQVNNAANSEPMITATENDAVQLYYDNAVKLATSSAGGTLTGVWVQTANIAADAITAAKIADDVINSEHYAADSIDEEHLANDCVGSAELKSLSTLLIKNSSGTTLKTVHGAGA